MSLVKCGNNVFGGYIDQRLKLLCLNLETMSLADTQTKAGNDPALISVSAKDIDILETLTLGANLQSE